MKTYPEDIGSSPEGAAPIIPRVDRTISDHERQNWQQDPESFGFSDEDRAFASEHGLSESELRAAETILRENGLN